jgi:hypothetical protein
VEVVHGFAADLEDTLDGCSGFFIRQVLV